MQEINWLHSPIMPEAVVTSRAQNNYDIVKVNNMQHATCGCIKSFLRQANPAIIPELKANNPSIRAGHSSFSRFRVYYTNTIVHVAK